MCRASEELLAADIIASEASESAAFDIDLRVAEQRRTLLQASATHYGLPPIADVSAQVQVRSSASAQGC